MNEDIIPEKYQKIWEKCTPLLKAGRHGDFEHALETVKMILDYGGRLKIDYDIIIPVATMHDIGHLAILDEHLKYVTGPDKIKNGKLVHLLTGAKIAKEVLNSVGYDDNKTQEIVDIISIHDFDSLEGVDIDKVYNTENKRIFHDFDRLDRFSEERIKNALPRYGSREKLIKIVEGSIDLFFLDEFKEIAKKRLKDLKSAMF